MEPLTLNDLTAALRSSWAEDTCSPDDLARSGWHPDNPALGHCDLTCLIVNDLFGGTLVFGKVFLDGTQHGYHWWNRLDSGLELDLTREQFQAGQEITDVQVVARPPGDLRRAEEYHLLRARLAEHLGPLPPPADGRTLLPPTHSDGSAEPL